MPRWCRPSASARPPIPAPTIPISIALPPIINARDRLPVRRSQDRLDGNPRRTVEFADKLLQQAKEHRAFLGGERRQDLHLRPARGLGEPFEHGFAGAGERQIAPPPIMRSDETP